MIETTLKKFGLSDKETKVYLAAIKSGPSPVRKLAEMAEINRGTTYDILRSLIQLGLVSYYHQDRHQYFVAENPDKIKDTLHEKINQLKKTKDEIDNILPELKSIYNKTGSKPVAKYYEGDSGIKIILQDVILSCVKGSKEYMAYSSTTIKKYLYQAYANYSEDRIKSKIKVTTISIGPGGETKGLDERKWLSKKASAPSYTLIYENKVAMISIDDQHKPLGVIIEDKNLFETQKMIFEALWKKIKK